MTSWFTRGALMAIGCCLTTVVRADTTPQTLPYTQNWSNAALIVTDNNWSAAPGFLGSRGIGLTASGGNPGTVTGTSSDVAVSANQTNPNVFATGGPAEFQLTDSVLALAGSNTAVVPYLILHLDFTGKSSVTVAYNARDLESGTDNAVQPLALQYRLGGTGSFVNVAAAYLADATIINAVQSTPVSVLLPAAVDNQALVELRWITVNASGNDEWVGIDDISVTAGGAPTNTPPNLAYNPALTSTITLSGGTVGTTGSASISVTPSGGSGSGTDATTVVNACAITGAGASAFGAVSGQPLSFVGNTTTAQNLGLSCTLAASAASAALDCTETRGSNPSAMRSWSLTCPAATPDIAPSVTSTTPANGATGVLATSNVVVNFSEAVSTSAGWFALNCSSSGNVSYTESGTGNTRTINPDPTLVAGESCTASVESTQVSDLDVPIDPMAADFSFTFTVAGAAGGAPTVTFTAPVQNQNPVRRDADVTVIFSESVTATASAFTLNCSISGAHPGSASSDAVTTTRYRFNPSTDFVYGDVCTFTVVANQVTDLGATPMTTNLVRTFTVADYYVSVNATSTGANLRSTLHPLIDQHTVFSYSQVWGILEIADQAPDNFNQILDVYKNRRYAKVSDRAGTGSGVTYNREHTWPNSLGFPVSSATPYTDTHMLYLSDTTYNANRGNFPYKNCPNTGGSPCGENPTEANFGIGGGSGSYPGNGNWGNSSQYETWNARKGDVARAVLYMDVRYEGTNGEVQLSLGETTSTSGQMASLTTLRAWHLADPPDAAERLRNDIIYAYQGNRNPYIDHPEYVECIYGDICAAANTPPNLAYSPNYASTVILSGGSLGATGSATITVTPSGGTGNGTNATTSLSSCAVTGSGFGAVSPATSSYVGTTTTPQALSLSCTIAASVQNGTLNCNEILGAAAPVVRSWPVQCPAFTPANTNTTVTSDLPDASKPFESVTVRVAVRATAPATGNPIGTVTVNNGDTGIYARSCSISLVGTAAEVGECSLVFPRAGSYGISANYSGNSSFIASASVSTALNQHSVRALEIVKTRPTPVHTNQGVSVAVNLDLIAFNASPQPTGTITVSDGTDSCLITLPARECLWSSTSEGLKQLQASYSGDSNYPALVSAKVPLQVGPNRYPELISYGQSAVVFEANGGSQNVVVSADGRYLAFASDANNLVSGDSNGQTDIFVRDNQTGSTTRANVDSSGAQANNYSLNPAISGDGRYVAFRSEASNLVSGDTNGNGDIFVRDIQTGSTTRVSVDSSGAQANSESFAPSLSADGRYVAFISVASNLVSGDSNSNGDIFVRDTLTDTTTRVSVDSSGAQANGYSTLPSLSANGRYVTFYSDASNLVSGDSNGQPDIFVRDLQTGNTLRVSVDSSGAQANNASFEPVLSADGRYVAFYSLASNLVSGDSNSQADVFMRDTLLGSTTRISVDSGGAQANGLSSVPSLSADGRFVTFYSSASNLVGSDSNGQGDVFVRDTQTSSTTRVSVDSSGAQANNASYGAAISSNGRYVAFNSNASNLVGGDNNGQPDIFVRDLLAASTTRVNVDSGGAQANGGNQNPAVSADGRYVAFESFASNLISGDSNAQSDIFVRDTQTGSITRANVDSSGAQAIGSSQSPVLSADGRYVAFFSDANNLVSGDSNGQGDVFLRDTLLGSTTLISVDSNGAQANGLSAVPAISADGRYVAFYSLASNLVSGDTNTNLDIFVRDTQTGSTTRVSVDSSGAQANANSASPVISADGRFVAFYSDASNLVTGDSNGVTDIFVRDTQTNSTARVSVDSSGAQANIGCYNPVISGNGRYVAFYSNASNLVSGDSNSVPDVFVRDTLTGSTTRVSVDSTGAQANGESSSPAISADGRYIAFLSEASNLVSGDSNAADDVFVRDIVAGTTTRPSVNRFGVEGNNLSYSRAYALSNNGLMIFGSRANNLAAGDDSIGGDLFLTRIPNFVAANSTTTLITADTPDPSAVNQAYSVAVSVSRTFTGSDVTGTVAVSDGTESCVATLSGSGVSASGSCNLSSSSIGTKNLTASYSGDANHAGSTSASTAHTVNSATVSGFTATGDSPDPSRLERTVTYSWNLTPARRGVISPNGVVTPTGTVTVKEAASCADAPLLPQHQCSATLPTSSCQIAFAATGVKSTVLCYSGDSSFAPVSFTESHEVVAATVPVSLAWLQSARTASNDIEVQFATATNVGTAAFDIAAVGLGQRSSRSDAGDTLFGASEVLASGGDSIRATHYRLRAVLPPGSTEFYLRGFDADSSVESFGPFTVGTQSGTDPSLDSSRIDWNPARTVITHANAGNRAALLRATSASGVYLQVSQAGVQQITAAELLAAGFSALEGTPIKELALSLAGDGIRRGVPIFVRSSDGVWNAGDSLQFIGKPADTQYSGTAVYTLARDPSFVLRIPVVSSRDAGVGQSVLPQNRSKRERLLFSPTSPGDSPWTWLRVAATTAPVSANASFELPNARSSAGLLTVTLQGGVDHDGAVLDHHVEISLNGRNVGELRFDGVRTITRTLAVPAGVLQSGTNSLSLRLPADTGLPSDVISLESLAIEANEDLSAQNGRMEIALSTQAVSDSDALLAAGFEDGVKDLLQLAMTGLSADADLYLQRGDGVQRVSGAQLALGQLRIGVDAQNGDKLIASDAAAYTPGIASIPDSADLLSGSAQYLVISHPGFIDQLGGLVAARQAQGLRTKVVSTEQVYAAFSGGEISADAIARYLAFAKTKLATEYVLLVGGDTLDARGFQNSGSISFVPTLYRQTSQLVHFAPSDAALADTNQDGVPDLAIGRMPVRSTAELTAVLQKTLQTANNNRALLVGDKTEPGLSFSDINQGLAPLLPNLQVQRAERDQLSAAQVNQQILDHVNQGGQWLQYFGHAGPARWGFENVLNTSQLSTLSNSQSVKVLQWACWTNYFVDPSYNTLGQAWLNQSAGASLVLGPGTLTETAHDELLAQKLLPLISQGMPLGKALLQAKQALAREAPGKVDVLLGVGLLGDPAK